MKRLVQVALLAVLAISLSTVTAEAQIPIKFGIKGGISSSTVIGDNTDNYTSRSGIVAGVFSRLNLMGPLGIQAELLLVGKGAKTTIEEESTGRSADVTLKADYFEVPVLLRFSLKGKGPAGINLYGGPVFAFGRSSKTQLETVAFDLAVDAELDNHNETSNDLGLALGVGVDLGLATSVIVLDVRYTVGIENMWEDVEEIPADLNRQLQVYTNDDGKAYDMKNSTISATVGFMF